jgi:alpha-N-arabinofuranosidase
LIEAPTYNSEKFGPVPYLDVSAASNTDGGVVLNVTNRHRDQPLNAIFEVEDRRFSGEFQIFEVNGPDIKAENNFNSTLVKTTQKSVSGNGTILKYTFPAHYFTMLKGRLA